MSGVANVDVDVPSATIDVSFDENAVSLDSIKETIEDQGYAVFG